eukprot:1305041-Prymnesium_polylepis.1
MPEQRRSAQKRSEASKNHQHLFWSQIPGISRCDLPFRDTVLTRIRFASRRKIMASELCPLEGRVQVRIFSIQGE